MKKILLSGFVPFGAYPVNSSQQVVWQLAQRRIHGVKIVPTIFDATIPGKNRGEVLVERAQALGASSIISLGMASEKKGLCIERWATNAVDNKKYCPPLLQGTQIDPRQPYGLRIALDLAPWNIRGFEQACTAESIVVEYSDDAGGFCCNHLAYQTGTALIEREETISYLFIHLPCSPAAIPNEKEFVAAGKVSMSVEKMVRGIELLLQEVAL
ncbi:MAG: hypothetical protein WCT45_02775 [Candidatus Paceibacterota bacterium]|jgi:pyroglutamyl-peptidase